MIGFSGVYFIEGERKCGIILLKVTVCGGPKGERREVLKIY